VRYASSSADGGRLAIVDGLERAHVWDTRTGQLIAGPLEVDELPPRATIDATLTSGVSGWGGGFRSCVLSPDGSRLALRARKFVQVCHLDSGDLFLIDIGSGFVSSVAFDLRSRLVLVAGSNNAARVWDARTGRSAGPPLHHPAMVRFAAFAPDGERVLTLTSDRRIRVWDAMAGEVLVPPFASFDPRPSRLWFSRRGNRIVGSSSDAATVRQWTLPSFTGSTDLALRLVHLLKCRQLDETDGVVRLPPDVFRSDVEGYKRAWIEWRRETDDRDHRGSRRKHTAQPLD